MEDVGGLPLDLGEHLPDRPEDVRGLNTTLLETDHDLLDRVLTPYKEHCRYLRTAMVERSPVDGALSLHCTFEIPESCYITDTGHFNSVEFNICYNQMAYFLIAKAVKESLVEPFDAWTLDDYWERQLPNILITDFQSRFRRPIDAASFSGVFELRRVTVRNSARPLIVLGTACRFEDAAGGLSEGTVKLAITDPPLPLHQLPTLARADRERLLERVVLQEFRNHMFMEESEELDTTKTYFDLGLTSLQLTEVKEALERRLDCEVDTTRLFNNPTIAHLLEHLDDVVTRSAGITDA
ncbi:hypothetical protein FLX08_10535 [Microbispora hainanensis]|uniref:(2E)-enoyl-[ACP] glycyltransferase n=2 Tax=Microbispora hainanensis TaxID=568844 RepID=A0A544YY16_9ACTN|nr:hypothetical protein FLX08_10535 [Microbispora hainanensis]